jgi:NTP pyrophosphatase (non-canonical NTP hydrolase)
MYKLIRDDMKHMIESHDPDAIVTSVLERHPNDFAQKYLEFLIDKLHEEVSEVIVELKKPNRDKNKIDDELGDVREVIMVLSDIYGYGSFEFTGNMKRYYRGSFYNGVLLDMATGTVPT